MKTLYESILDDEDVLINKAIENSYWVDIYKLLKGKKGEEAAKILNDKLKPCKYGEWRKDTALHKGEQVVNFYKDGAACGPMRITNVADKNQLKFNFLEFVGEAVCLKNDFYKHYGVKYDDFRNKFRANLIKELGLKKDNSRKDEWIMEI